MQGGFRQSLFPLIAVTGAFFTDGFLYGLVIPLTPYSPAQAKEPWMLGVMFSAYALGVFLGTPLFGIFSDRFGRRRPMLWGVLFQILAVMVFAFASQFSTLCLARICQGMAAAASWTAGLALIADHFQKDRAQAMGIVMMGNTIGQVLGPTAGGILLEYSGFRSPFFVAVFLLLVDGLLRWGFILDSPIQLKKSGASQLIFLLRDRAVLATSVIVALGAWCWSVLEALYPDHLGKATQAQPSVTGGVFTLACLIYGVSCPIVGIFTDRYGAKITMVLGLIAMAILLPFLAEPKTVIKAAALLSLVSVAYGFAMNPALTELSDAVDRRGVNAYATVYAIYNIFFSIGMVGSDAAAGVLASFLSFQISLSIIGALMLFCLFTAYFLRSRTKTRSKGLPNLAIDNT